MLELKCKTTQTNELDLRTKDDGAGTDVPYFINNALPSLFSECTVSADGVKIDSIDGNYAHKTFIETELSSSRTAENTWLVCQGY